MKLVVDLRRAFDSGLGTYIRHVVPLTLARLPDVIAIGLIATGDADRHRAYLGALDMKFLALKFAPLSIAEQWPLRYRIPPDAVFWATTLSHALFKRQRLVATVHDVAQLALPSSAGFSPGVRAASRLYFSSLRRQSSLLLFNSQFTADEFDRLVGPPVGQRCITPLGVDLAHWAAVPVLHTGTAGQKVSSRAFFLWIGNLRPHKNFPTLLHAFEKVADTLAHDLVVVGRAPAGTPADQFKKSLPAHVSARVHMLGEVEDAVLRHLMHTAQALVVPSFYEGFGLPLLEGFAAQCLVLSSDAGALRETGGNGALYFDPCDVDDLARGLLFVARMSAAERQVQIDLGLALARSSSWERTAALTAQALLEVFSPCKLAPQESPPSTPANHRRPTEESTEDAH